MAVLISGEYPISSQPSSPSVGHRQASSSGKRLTHTKPKHLWRHAQAAECLAAGAPIKGAYAEDKLS